MALLKKARGALIAIGILTAAGALAIVLRLWLRGYGGGVPAGDTVWNLKCRVELTAREGTIVRIARPADTAHIRVFGQDFTTPGMRQERSGGRGAVVRDFTAVAFRPGRFSPEADFDLHLSPQPGRRPANGEPGPTPDDRARLLQPEPHIRSDDVVVAATLRPLLDQQPAGQRELLELIFEYCTQQLTFDPESENDDAVAALQERVGTSLGRARAMVALCRAARIPARLVAGFVLEERNDAQPHVWVEVWGEKKWRPFDPEFGHAATLPANFLPMRRGGSDVVRTTKAEDVAVRYELQRQPVPRGMLSGEGRSPLEILDMTRLPLATQLSLITLILLPFGALVTTFFRNVIGVRTFGTFSPTLLALAAVYAEWKSVTIIFVLVIVFGIGGRALLPGFKLMQVPRLSIVFTLVAVSMLLSVSLLDYFGLNPTGHIALLPMVVLTSLVDRMYTVADEDGMRVAAVRLGWTAAVGALCFFLFLWKGLGRVLLEFPELHFFTIAAMLLFGLYAGKKLADVPFSAFLREPEKQKPLDEKPESTPAETPPDKPSVEPVAAAADLESLKKAKREGDDLD